QRPAAQLAAGQTPDECLSSLPATYSFSRAKMKGRLSPHCVNQNRQCGGYAAWPLSRATSARGSRAIPDCGRAACGTAGPELRPATEEHPGSAPAFAVTRVQHRVLV